MKILLGILLCISSFSASATDWIANNGTGNIYVYTSSVVPNPSLNLRQATSADYAAQQAAAVAYAAANPIPNPNGFAQAVKTGMGGIVAANALMQSYPAFFPAIQTQVWVDVQSLILDAQSKGVISSSQYSAIKAAATANNIPVVLP